MLSTIATIATIGDRGQTLRRFLEEEVWPEVPRNVLGRRVTRKEREVILGFGPDGV